MRQTAELRLSLSQFGDGQRSFLKCRDPYVGLFGGYGSGKSTALMWKMLQLAIANEGMPGLLIAQTYGALYANIVEPFIALMEKTGIADALRPRLSFGRYPKMTLSNGSMVHLRSAEKPEGYEGLTVAWVAGDEIRYWSKRAYDIAIARVRMKQAALIQRVFSSTPSMNWVADEFNADLPRTLVRAPTVENIANLPPDYIDGLRASYSKQMQRAVLEGMFTILEGAVFDDFDPSPSSPWIVNLEPTEFYLEPRRCYLAVDPGYRKSAWLWIVENDDADWIVYDQMMADNMNDGACVRDVNARGWPVDEIWVDPAGKAKQSYEGMSTLDALRHIKTRSPAPIRMLQGANRDIVYGTDKLRVLLGDTDGERPIRLRFARRLIEQEKGRDRGIVKDLSASEYEKHKDGRPISDMPLKDGVHDHARDALRYWAVGMFLTDHRLKRLDPVLANRKGAGYSVAA